MPKPKGAPGQLRVRLGFALRDARKRANLNQTEAAALINAKQPKISNLESASVEHIKLGDLNLLMEAYGITGDLAEELRRWARSPYNGNGVWVDTAPGAAWWQQHQEIEGQARVIKTVHLQAHDGLIQSEAYMRRQFELGNGINIEPRVKARLARQRALFDKEHPPACTFVLDEACLHKDMGDPAMMVAQLEHLLRLSERDFITILIVPFDAPFPASTYGFSLLQFDSAAMNDFVTVEYEVGSATIDDEDAVRLFIHRWELIRSATMSEHDSRELMRRMLGQFKKRAKG